MATEHLLRQGWRRPACVTRPSDTATTEQRRLGYEDVMRRHGLPAVVRHVPFHADSGSKVVDELFGAAEPPDSLLTVDSMLNLGVMMGLKRRMLQIGRDVGLIGFDDAVWTQAVEPPLSVIAQPAYEMGVAAAKLLIDRIRDGAAAEPQTMIMSTTMIVRGSSRRTPLVADARGADARGTDAVPR
jgi:LacI family transcriptional regulator